MDRVGLLFESPPGEGTAIAAGPWPLLYRPHFTDRKTKELKKSCPSYTRSTCPPTFSLSPLSVSGHSCRAHRDAVSLWEYSGRGGHSYRSPASPIHQQPRGRKGPVVQWSGRQ